MKKVNLFYPKLSYIICGLCFKAHNQLGRYRNEKQYADFLEQLFKNNKIKFKRELKIIDKEINNQNRSKVDFLINDKIILELKSKQIITKEDYYQLKRYLVSANKRLGILVNFRNKYLRPKRIIN